MKIIDINIWKRKEHFNFFSQFDEPFYGVVSEIDCTIAYKIAKDEKHSFFAYYLHKSLIAINEIEEFKYRIVDDKVVIYDKINASTTIGRDDETFAFSFIKFDYDFDIFNDCLLTEIKNVKNSEGLRNNENAKRLDVIHFSSIPWIKFTGLTHARSFKFRDSVPKITIGKVFLRDKKMIMPVSINAHHGLSDGLHAGKYLELFQKLMNEK